MPRSPPEVSPAPRPAPPRPYPRPAPPPPALPGEQVFGIALVSDFFLLVTGVAGSCFYCKQRGAFAAADERAKGTVHFSDNDKKFGKKGRGRKGKGRAREIQLTNMRNAL